MSGFTGAGLARLLSMLGLVFENISSHSILLAYAVLSLDAILNVNMRTYSDVSGGT